MVMYRFFITILFFYSLNLFAIDNNNPISDGIKIRIDSIKVVKNWRTKDAIILSELDFKEGDQVSIGVIDSSMIKVYNIGNFARVEYDIDTLENGKNLITITAKDALTIVPILSFSGSREGGRAVPAGRRFPLLVRAGTAARRRLRRGAVPVPPGGGRRVAVALRLRQPRFHYRPAPGRSERHPLPRSPAQCRHRRQAAASHSRRPSLHP